MYKKNWFYRFSLQDGKYKVIKSPIDLAECKSDDVRSFLGRSEKGVYFAAIYPMDILPSFQNAGRFGFFTYIVFAKHLDITYV